MSKKKVTKQSRLTLAELAQVAAKVNSMLVESEGEVTLEIEKLESEFKDQFEDKVQAVAYLIKKEQSNIEFDKQLIKDIQQRMKSRQSKIDGLERYLLYGLQLSGVDTVDGVHSVKLYKKADSLQILEADKLPDQYMTGKIEIKTPLENCFAIEESLENTGVPEEWVKKTFSPDRKELLAALKEGANIPGAALIENQKRLSIK